MRNQSVSDPLRQARIDSAKVDRFYGTQKGLLTSRKRSAVKTKQHHAVLNALKRIGL